MKKLRDFLFLLIGIAVILGSIYLFLQKPASKHFQEPTVSTQTPTSSSQILKIKENLIPVEVANTQEKRTLGLSGRKSMEEGTGLLFIFDVPQNYGFWMKDMHFAIDIIWISDVWEVVGIESDVKPETFPKIFYPGTPVKHVLEVPAGTVERMNIDIGSEVYLIDEN